MKVMILDDNEYKVENIINSISKIVAREDITVCTYANEGLRELHDNFTYDYLILDMQFPILKGDRIEPEEGLAVLHRLSHRKHPVKIIFCSSERKDYSKYDIGNVKGYILYDSSIYLNPMFEELMK